MNTVIYYKGPLGEMAGDWQLVAQHRHDDARYKAQGWNEWLPYDEAQKKLLEANALIPAKYSWGSPSTKSFAYIGPEIASNDLTVGNILLEISRAPFERHVLKHSTWTDWKEWTMVFEIYCAVRRNYPDLSLPEPLLTPQNRPIAKLSHSSRWKGTSSRNPAQILLKKGGIPRINATNLFTSLQEGLSKWRRVDMAGFRAFIDTAVDFKRYIQQELHHHAKFTWPGLGTFWLENTTNRSVTHPKTRETFIIGTSNRLRFRTCKRLRDILHGRTEYSTDLPFGGEANAFSNLHFWQSTSKQKPLSRRRELARAFAKQQNITTMQAIEYIQLLTDVICANLVASGKSDISGFGVFSVQSRKQKRAVHFREFNRLSLPEDDSVLPWLRRSGLALNCPKDTSISSKWTIDWFHHCLREKDIEYSDDGMVSLPTAQQIVTLLTQEDHAFLTASILRYVKHTLPEQGHASTSEAVEFLDQFATST